MGQLYSTSENLSFDEASFDKEKICRVQKTVAARTIAVSKVPKSYVGTTSPNTFEYDSQSCTSSVSINSSIDDSLDSDVQIKTSSLASPRSIDYEIEESKTTETSAISNHTSLHDFEILKLLGQGSHGKVYLVRRKSGKDDQYYAMKELRKTSVRSKDQKWQTRNEFYINTILAAERAFPYVAKLYWAFQTKERLYMVFEFCSGGELYFHLGKRGRLPIHLARLYAAELVYALGFLHECGIVYRDLKPENIVLGSNGHIKLVDFGLSKMPVHYEGIGESKQSSLDQERYICGTTEYLSPEILRGGNDGFNVDWWAFGMVLFEMVTGLPPWYSYDQSKVIQGILHQDVVFPDFLMDQSKDCSDLRSLIKGLLVKSPLKRLGGVGKHGSKQIMSHSFFESICWGDIASQNFKSPFTPPSQDLTCNFDESFLNSQIDFEATYSRSTFNDEFSYFNFCPRGKNVM
mmetsp:Transcript_13883/g.16838  ORF Transcript_13883/g.16838 Transcript_13883/m.16838 type:complete len:461 (+) Transcript_13883:79-1461(+)|eukprot:CAMPEP_0184028830 /NCGR_PEP_ID=MMETSP0954-20121128/15076_1 /TAXON_ID=627963 /ORGANISM="Aplanochytrium sp, Strain PBS07" /LENGTH=460 /DNA_ID=CAMNT_0026313753 /DNA_START=277 /DNA_END=1659 /DNA_ORIENTATION=-